MHLRRTAAALSLPLAVVLGACAPADEEAPATTPQVEENATPAECAADKVMTEGVLTIATDTPAYPPWFEDNDPSNGQGFESAVAYEVADRLGFKADAVEWTVVPFDNSYAPGAKKFDFDINQISISPERAEVVDFSASYYDAAQAVIMLEGGDEITGLDDLEGLRLGAQTGTTSLTAIRQVIEPDTDPLVFENTNAAKQALLNDQVDAILADLPTAFYITAAEIPEATLVGQFQPQTGKQEAFGMLFEKGNPLVTCVNGALAEMREDGTLAAIETEWLSDTVDVPALS